MRHGFILINKPRGPTSHDIVGIVRRTLSEPKAGHLGTLDPLADGLMVVAVGAKALKVVELFGKLTKQYIATLKLGAVSTTYDAEGMIEEKKPKPGWKAPVDSASIQAIIDDHFVGKIKQTPPAFSAVHVGGERAYRKAMRGENVELKAREIGIQECRVIEYAYPKLVLQVSCDSGTYIRSLANDIGEHLRCGAYLEALTRTRVGEWSLEKAVSAEKAKWTDVLPLKDILASFPGLEITDASWSHLQHGRSINGDMKGDVLIAWHEKLPVALLEKSSKGEGMLKPRKVL